MIEQTEPELNALESLQIVRRDRLESIMMLIILNIDPAISI